MYLEHYGLNEAPYSITPDPRFVFLSERHRDALAHLLFGIGQGGGGGFVQLTGEVGTGKTTLSRLLLEQLPENTRVALLLNPRLGPIELLETLCEELHVDISNARGSGKALVDALNAYLLRAYADGLRVVLIVDEAQNLSAEALEQVRLLTNLETDTQKLLQIVLIGQPELRDVLAKPELRQLAQRITARFHLTPLSANETGQYLRHRFRIAGGRHFPLTAAAVQRVHKHANGVPRLVNVIAERALLAGYARDASSIDPKLVDAAAREVLPARNATGGRPPPAWLLATAGVSPPSLGWPVSSMRIWRGSVAPAGAPSVEGALLASSAFAAFGGRPRPRFPGVPAASPVFGAGSAGGVEDLVHHEVGLGRGGAAQREGLVREARVQGVPVGVGVDGDRGDALVAGRADDADGDLAAVGDEHLRDGLGGSAEGQGNSVLYCGKPSADLVESPILVADSVRSGPILCRGPTNVSGRRRPPTNP